jgi:hypothetical protein
MTPPLEAEALAKSRLDDYFTATVVGLPQEVSLGNTFVSRMLKGDQFVTIDTISAKAWLSDPAREQLKQQLKQSQHSLGLPFPTGSSARDRRWGRVRVSAFLWGFGTCLLIVTAYLIQPWLRLPLPL